MILSIIFVVSIFLSLSYFISPIFLPNQQASLVQQFFPSCHSLLFSPNWCRVFSARFSTALCRLSFLFEGFCFLCVSLCLPLSMFIIVSPIFSPDWHASQSPEYFRGGSSSPRHFAGEGFELSFVQLKMSGGFRTTLWSPDDRQRRLHYVGTLCQGD